MITKQAKESTGLIYTLCKLFLAATALFMIAHAIWRSLK
jgi:hypothetical protein